MKYCCCLLLLGLLSACGSGDARTPELINSGHSKGVYVSGRVSYDFVPPLTSEPGSGSGAGLDYSAIQELPVRGALVELLDAEGAVLRATNTDLQGEYQFTVEPERRVRVRVKASLRREGAPGWDIQVRDNTQGRSLYALEGSLHSSGGGHSRRDLHAESGWGGQGYDHPRAAAPFAILDSIYGAMERILVLEPNLTFPPLTVYWSTENRPVAGELALGEIGTSYYLNGEIYLLGHEDLDTEEFDRHVILHEWGHYLEDNIYRTDTTGGNHGLQSHLDMRVAMSEGFANAFAAMMLDDPVYRDTWGPDQSWANTFVLGESERATALPRGWYSQASVSDILYGYYSDESNSHGYDIFHRVLGAPEYRNADSLTSIYLFAHQLDRHRPGALDIFLDAQEIAGRGSLGEGETNSGEQSPDTLPVYKPLFPDNRPVEVCSLKGYGKYNKLANRQYLVLNIGTPGEYSIHIGGPVGGGGDPDFRLFKRGAVVAQGQSRGSSTERHTQFLAGGQYVLEVYDWRNLDPGIGGTDACFSVRVGH